MRILPPSKPQKWFEGGILGAPPDTESNGEEEEEDLPQLPPLENASQKHACDYEKVVKNFEDTFSDSSSSFADDDASDCEEGEATPLHESESTKSVPEVAEPLGDISPITECVDVYSDFQDLF